MKLTRPKYLVALTGHEDEDALEVEITPGDRFRAELEAGKWGIPSLEEAPTQHIALWVWCSLVRQKVYAGDWPTFKNEDLYTFQGTNDEQEASVDPTQEAATSASASSSPTGSPDSSTGSTPPSPGSPPA